MKRIQWVMLLALCAMFSPLLAAEKPGRAAIASAHPIATAAGLEVLQAGGNAFDAAVAVSATLAVVEPYSSGIGGGGFWLLHRARDGKQVMIDGREKAPFKAHRDMYLDKSGTVVPGLSMDGPLAAGIPGEPAALVHLAENYGRLPLKTSLAPAIRAAEQGFPVTVHYQRMAKFRLEALRASPAAAAVFLKQGEVPPLGHLIRQRDLAHTLKRLAEKGREGFYSGQTAQLLVKGSRADGGIWQLRDLSAYKVIEREPVVIEYGDYRIVSAAPPSSGGVALKTMLNILSGYQLDKMSRHTRTHLLVESMRRAYRDRAAYMGDPLYVDMPLQKLGSMEYARELRESIDLEKATPSSQLKKATPSGSGFHTTHFSIIDKQGNRVAATLSINYPFGSGYVVPGTGVLLNDEMDDFSAKPGTPNAYGLVGAEANAIAPGKRMLSSMSPSFVEGRDRIAVVGTPGGSRIITMVLHGILGVVDGRSAAEIVSAPRYHHQYLPDVIQYEKAAFNDEMRTEMQFLGHHLRELENPYGNMQVVIWNRKNGELEAASDPRGEGQSVVR